ncbi:MAG: MaoC family dehydratase N-terminal domain-containing protein [Deltaproteobacteria bacterium]|nr:MaoC family dehydratase N-terminal domain-containing protein [Deltaproteobacteria bacterium]
MSNYRVGDELAPMVAGEVTRELITAYSQVSMDPNPMHTDEELAKAMGYPTVYAQGMLGMAMLARHLGQVAGMGKLHRIKCRFKTMTWPGETITCRAKVTAVEEKDGKQLVTVEIHTENQDGEPKVLGEAVFAV